MAQAPSPSLLERLEALLGPRGFIISAEAMEPWLTDWRGRVHGKAAAMLAPTDLDEVRRIVAWCAEDRVAIVPQGGNTSMVAGATPPADGKALLLSMRRMNRIRAVSADENMLVAEAGTILDQVHRAAAEAGRRFPLSLGARGSATIGGLVSTNAGGTQVLRFGPMRALVLGLEAVMADGSVHHGLSALRKDNRGYDLKHLLIGGEGTLGVVTAASLKLVQAAGSRAVAWVGMSGPSRALSLLRFLEDRIGERVESFELVPADALALVLAHVPGTRPPLAEARPWNLLVETVAPTGAGAGAAEAELETALAAALEAGLAEDAVQAASEAQAEALWRLRESIAEAERAEAPGVKTDISVPVAAMPSFLESGKAAVEARFPGARVVAFGHLGDGNIHFNILAPRDADGEAWLRDEGERIADFVYDRVAAAGGSISAEHGIGQTKIEALARTTEPARLALQRRIKEALDPFGIMNPGKLFP
jgi:FAD/FMN-containing dehydrogenase